jgi:ADP-heptose:LPS heptosyltransferase
MHGDSKSPARILVVRNDRVGDLVLTLPALQYLRRAFPAAEITVLTAPRTASLLATNRDVDRVLPDDGRTSSGQLARRLRPYHFDAAVVIHTTTRNFLAVWRAGIPTRVTWSGKPIGWLTGTRLVHLRRSRPPIHESQFALAFARRLRDDPRIELSDPQLQIPSEVVQAVQARIALDLGGQGPLLGVHPGSYGSTYNWPLPRYAELIARLAEQGRVVVTGGPGEETLLGELHGAVPAPLAARVACYADFDLLQLSAAIAGMDVLTVSNTGPMHLAGVLGTPTVALFSAHPLHGAAKWAPFGSRTTILQAPLRGGESAEVPAAKAWEHMDRISVDQVWQANCDHLRRGQACRSA